MTGVVTLPIVARDICKTFRPGPGEVVRALDGVSLEARRGTLTALVGPDGAGKTTLIRLVAGLFSPDGGTLNVLDIDVVGQPQAVQDRIGYMPQKFGLYEDLSVRENLDLYADLHGYRRRRAAATISAAHADDRPWPFHAAAGGAAVRRHEAEARPGLHAGAHRRNCCCSMSRRSASIRCRGASLGHHRASGARGGPHGPVSTSYLDEAERCDHVIVLHPGQVLAQGTPAASPRPRPARLVPIRPRGQSARPAGAAARRARRDRCRAGSRARAYRARG